MIFLSDDYRKDKQEEINDFLAQFDEITGALNKNDKSDDTDDIKNELSKEEAIAEFLNDTDSRPKRKTRSERLAEEREQMKKDNMLVAAASAITDKASALTEKIKNFRGSSKSENADGGVSQDDDMTTKKTKKKKYKLNKKKFVKRIILFLFLICLLIGLLGIGYVVKVIAQAPDINPDNIYTMLSESSVLYDQDGNIIATVGSDETRTNIEYSDLPKNLVNAVIAIEDKTFETHNGFNIIRIFGAIKEAIFSGEEISGTSTITQQLARNVYLTEQKSVRSIERKIAEAYYSIIIERELSKDLIMEAYLNTIFLGFDSYGVQAAAQSYFSKDVHELDLIECAALASLPKAPDKFALIKKLNPEDVNPEKDIIVYTGDTYTYVYNGEASAARRELTLYNMCEFGFISEDERDAALADDLLSHINPNMRSLQEISSYSSDYAIEQVIADYAEAYNMEYADAKQKVYTSGLQIFTTIDTNMQKIVETEFENNENFPKVSNLKKDKNGNILGKNGKLLLYDYNNFFDENGRFTFAPGEYEWLPNGDLKLFSGNRLNFYKTTVQGEIDISVEFKNLYTIEEDVFYSIQGGVLLIPQQYKTRDDDGNAIIDADFFASEDYKNYIKKDADGNPYITSDYYTLKQKVVQPQSAMTITDYHTGHIKAMVGGRSTTGLQLYNRATNPRQPGSSIKPITVYGAALQQSLEIMQGGSTPAFVTTDNAGNEVGNSYGTYFTAASVIDDAPLMFEGRIWPKNWYTGYRGLYTFRTSVEQSVNVNAVKVLQQVGTTYAANFGEKLGITSILREGDVNDMNASALALGGMTNGISPLEIASAYGAYANGGTYVEPVIYTHVTNKHGEVILENNPRTEEVVDPGVAFIMTDILRSTVTSGLGSGASLSNQPVCGKTGTTTDNYDAWFVGFTPQYTAAVWIGNDVNIELSKGSAAATYVWKTIMSQVVADIPAGSYPSQPSNVISVEIDTKSGLLPSEISALDDRGTIRSEYFIRGTEPTETDNVHQYVEACAYTGYLATPSCPAKYMRFGVMRPYPADPEVGDIAYEAPHYYCPLHNPDPLLYPIQPVVPNEDGTVNEIPITPPTIPEGTEIITPGDTTGSGLEGEGNEDGNEDNVDGGNGNEGSGNTDIPIVDTPIDNGAPDWL